MKIDMHSHTCYSPDCNVPLERVMEVCQRRGIDRLCVTDHNEIEGALRLRDIAPNLVIVGEEIKTTNGEIIGLFIEELIPPRLSPTETITRIRAQNGLVYIPHPLDRVRREAMGKPTLLSIIDDVDIIEVLNARVTIPRDNELARQIAQTYDMAMGAGSDAHTAYEYGRVHVDAPPFTGRADFIDSLRRGQIVGKVTTPFIHFITSFIKLQKRSARNRAEQR